MKNNILITINKLEDIKKLKELGINNYVLPIRGYCVGIPNTFLISLIPKNSYIYINRILDNDSIDKLKEDLKDNQDKIKGIIFDDLGVLEIVKDMKMEKILYLSHFNTNEESTAIYLNYVDSCVVSTDITKNELERIVNKFPNKLTIFTLGYVSSMYSRRLLLDNYTKFHHLPYQDTLHIDNTNHKFLVYENEYGTIFYHEPIFNGLELLSFPAKYFFINSSFLNLDDIIDMLNGKKDLGDTGFLYQATIFKLKGDQND